MVKYEQNSLADSKEEWGGGTASSRAEILLQPVEKTKGKLFVPLQPMEDHIRDHRENITAGIITLHVLFLTLHF